MADRVDQLPGPRIQGDRRDQRVVRLDDQARVANRLRQGRRGLLEALGQQAQCRGRHRTFHQPQQRRLAENVRGLFGGAMHPRSLPCHGLGQAFGIDGGLRRPHPQDVRSVMSRLGSGGRGEYAEFIRAARPQGPIAVQPRRDERRPHVGRW